MAGGNANLSATLRLTTKIGEVAIHNVSNRYKLVNVPQLVRGMTGSRRGILIGDFDLHRGRWGGRLFMASEGCPGASVLGGGVCVGDTASCIGLAFVGKGLGPRFLGCSVNDIPGWAKSDHRPIITSFDIELSRDETKRFLWHETPKSHYAAIIADALKPLESREIEETHQQIDACTIELRDIFLHAINGCVPTRLAYPSRPSRPQSDAARSVIQPEDQSEAVSNPRKGPGWGRFWMRWSSRVLGGDRKKKGDSWRRFVSGKAKTTRGVHQMARLAKRVCQPKDKGRIPPLVSNKVTYTTEEEKGNCLRNSIWPETSDGEVAPELQPPEFPPGRIEHPIDQDLTEEELDKIIRGLPTGKAAGADTITNEAIKMARIQLVPFLTRLFRACLRLSYHPDIFKHAITVILPKDGKDNYNDPKSWRPIALLPALGKLLEKIVAGRIKKLAADKNLLPNSQYGAAGKSTSHALQDLLRPVYDAWSRGIRWREVIRKVTKEAKKKATVMSLDISGAYDHVARDKLLEILVAKGLPRWMVMFVWSFLSNRSTVLKMPGSTTKQFFVNIGIPQGSPLSPILFLFFTAPVFEEIRSIYGAAIYSFAYVDDTYLVAVSTSYDQNCKGLEKAHEAILGWAGRTGVTFSPHKYKVMHFKRPQSKEADYKRLPQIPGLHNLNNCLVTEMNILGVIVDHQLTWDAHIAEIEKKVNTQLRRLRRISGSIWGLSLEAARKIYLSKIRPIISYACAVWFVWSPYKLLNWALSPKNRKQLRYLQSLCLKQISGSLGRCSARVLEKELNIEKIEIFLYRAMLTQRANSLTALSKPPHGSSVCNPGSSLHEVWTAMRRNWPPSG
ncbi:hypothetical protein NM208_g11477 [Fusarium decemcellulare]|uniref:Uncharacterized protein n=1 Tax=Fusarium decemcellulare TaxID=57161 RepID=A0ACC1RTI8_9HYPO|nr:hypothetical protein NM208_g11477 [Fusarium decemcellulare]